MNLTNIRIKIIFKSFIEMIIGKLFHLKNKKLEILIMNNPLTKINYIRLITRIQIKSL